MQTAKSQVHAYAKERAREAILEWVALNPGRLSTEAALDYVGLIAFAGVERFDRWVAGQFSSGSGSWRQVVDAGVRVETGYLLPKASDEEGGSEATGSWWPRRPDTGGSGVAFQEDAVVDAAVRFSHTLARRYLQFYDLSRSYGNGYDVEDLCQTGIMTGLDRWARLWNPERGRWQTFLWECIRSGIHSELRKHAKTEEQATDSAFFDRQSIVNFEEVESFKLLFFAVDTWAKLNLSPKVLKAYSGRMSGSAPGNADERVAFSHARKVIRAKFGPLNDALAS